MKNPIEFAPHREINLTESLWAKPQQSTYEDLILKPEYAERRLRFEVGQTWLRIIPALAKSVHPWVLPLYVLEFNGGRFVHPRSLTPRARSVYDVAYGWLKENAPDSLFSKANKEGTRLLGDPVLLFWALVEKDGRYTPRLILERAYDGSRGGVPGLAHRILKLTQELDENGRPVADAISPEAGVLLGVEKTQAPGAKYPGYQLKLGRQPRPIVPLLEEMAPEERSVIRPLEEVVRPLTDEEQWTCLAKLMTPETVAKIRESVGK